MGSRHPPPNQQQPVQQFFCSSIPIGAACMSGFGYAVPTMLPRSSLVSQGLQKASTYQSFKSIDTIDKSKDDLLKCTPTKLKKFKWYDLKSSK
ncbi:hypothetical protein EDB80DRAFT_880063 [Ilyonectria destructans]|nr:hypothetical protein EDB80DRAFT_880063 [Ilyonectria destructans]